MAIPFVVVEPVADDETILDCESDIVDLHLGLASRGFVEKTGCPKALREARPQDVLQIRKCKSSVDDVLDDDAVLAVQRRIEIFLKADFARSGRAFRLAH